MNTATLIARVLLGVIFVVFGLSGFLQFLPQPAMPPAAIAFFGGLAASGYMLPLLFATQVLGGTLLLLGMVALAVVILAPDVTSRLSSDNAWHLLQRPRVLKSSQPRLAELSIAFSSPHAGADAAGASSEAVGTTRDANKGRYASRWVHARNSASEATTTGSGKRPGARKTWNATMLTMTQ